MSDQHFSFRHTCKRLYEYGHILALQRVYLLEIAKLNMRLGQSIGRRVFEYLHFNPAEAEKEGIPFDANGYRSTDTAKNIYSVMQRHANYDFRDSSQCVIVTKRTDNVENESITDNKATSWFCHDKEQKDLQRLCAYEIFLEMIQL